MWRNKARIFCFTFNTVCNFTDDDVQLDVHRALTAAVVRILGIEILIFIIGLSYLIFLTLLRTTSLLYVFKMSCVVSITLLFLNILMPAFLGNLFVVEILIMMLGCVWVCVTLMLIQVMGVQVNCNSQTPDCIGWEVICTISFRLNWYHLA